MNLAKKTFKNSALELVVFLGLVSLFADVTYEGARSINGQYLAIFGAGATVVGIVAGLGELIGYTLRLVSGYIADKTGRYWIITIIGYTINLLVVPLLAFAGCWQMAALLMVSERIGKSIRTPARDVILSSATKNIGRGWGFGLHEALDQIGAVTGPLIAALILGFKGSYQSCFLLFLVPAILALSILFLAQYTYPNPIAFEVEKVKVETKGFSKSFWLYIIAVGLVAAGYADFPLIAYHLKKVSIGHEEWIPAFYALAMSVDAISALFFGRMFDKVGVFILAVVVCLSSFFAPLVFFGNLPLVILGMILWGIGMGVQESIMRAYIAETVSINKRGTAYGIFNSFYGLFWFLGSVLMGILYDVSISYLVIFSVIIQLASIPIFLLINFKKV